MPAFIRITAAHRPAARAPPVSCLDPCSRAGHPTTQPDAYLMNKHCYRLRFHHRTAQLIPVAEIHTASSRGGTRRSRPRRGLAALPLAGLLLASPAPAQIVPADNQASTVTIAPNGVPVINIAAPDASGLSHNRFSHLNVTLPVPSSTTASWMAGHNWPATSSRIPGWAAARRPPASWLKSPRRGPPPGLAARSKSSVGPASSSSPIPMASASTACLPSTSTRSRCRPDRRRARMPGRSIPDRVG